MTNFKASALSLFLIAVVANAQEEGAGKPNKKTDRSLRYSKTGKQGKSAPPTYDNECAGAALKFDSKLCVDFDVPPPQAGANVTKGYIGKLDDNGILPNTKRFWESAMCPVNVHW